MALSSQSDLNTNKRRSTAPTFALWEMGFRPFYLLASLFAAMSIPLWVTQYAGYLPAPYLPGALWHGYEMLFGYTTAVIAGFLLTAVRTWSGHSTPTRLPLAGLVLLWLAGRIVIFMPYPVAAMILNASFPLAVAIAIAMPLIKAANRRNYFAVVLLIFMASASSMFQLTTVGTVAWLGYISLQFGLDLVLLIVVVIAGRVVPMFTNNGIPGTKATRNSYVEKTALAGVIFLLIADILQPAPQFVALIAGATAAVHAARLFLWQPWRTIRTPLVWILHAAYAWVIAYLVLRGLVSNGLVPTSVAIHTLTVGAIGSMTIGMMARTSRGHTGHPLQTGKIEMICFLLVQCAAIIRLAGGIFLGEWYVTSVLTAGVCWSGAFVLFLARYWSILVHPRIDGKPG